MVGLRFITTSEVVPVCVEGAARDQAIRVRSVLVDVEVFEYVEDLRACCLLLSVLALLPD